MSNAAVRQVGSSNPSCNRLVCNMLDWSPEHIWFSASWKWRVHVFQTSLSGVNWWPWPFRAGHRKPRLEWIHGGPFLWLRWVSCVWPGGVVCASEYRVCLFNVAVVGRFFWNTISPILNSLNTVGVVQGSFHSAVLWWKPEKEKPLDRIFAKKPLLYLFKEKIKQKAKQKIALGVGARRYLT